ncbi:unnamed protein product [Coregonus sp. 'balchen']|nr:unnamed protein product [Coregonus sp. 'balchen']
MSPSVVVHPGDNVTLQCINVLKKLFFLNGIRWLIQARQAHENVNRAIVLKITEVDVADSGLYFCGMLDNYFIFTNATVLKV